MLRRSLFAAALALACLPSLAWGQGNTTGLVVDTCGTVTSAFKAGNPGPFTVDVNGNLCGAGGSGSSVSGFKPSASGARATPLTVTTSDSTGTLPTGAVVVVSNVGTTNPMYCNVNNIAATTSDQLITANGGWFAFTIPATITNLRCIATGGSTTANMVGGSGLATGTGGGSGGSSGGSVTQGTDPWLVAGKGTAGTPSGGVVTVQGVTSMTPFLANPGTAANWGVGAFAAAIGANGQATGLYDGTNLIRAKGDETLGAWANMKGWGGTALGAPSAYGTSPGAVNVPGVNAFVTNATAPITPADGLANPTTAVPVINYGVVWNGATWDRTPGSTAGATVKTADVCASNAKTNLPISFQTTSLTQQIAASGSNKIYICSVFLVASAATVFSITGGTGSNCGTGTAAIIGATSATHGVSLAANGGFTLGNGAGTVAVTAASSELCSVQSGAGDLVGNITYVQAP